MDERKRIEYPQDKESGIAKAQVLLEEITTKLDIYHPGFITTATKETQTGQGRNVSRFGNVTTIIDDAIKNKIMHHLDKTGEWDSRYYDDISTAIPTYGVLDSIIEELEKNQTIKDIIREAKEKEKVLDISKVTLHGKQGGPVGEPVGGPVGEPVGGPVGEPVGGPVGEPVGGRKMRKSSKRHRKSNKKYRKGNKKHKKSIKKHRR
jgi:hypothetical protein